MLSSLTGYLVHMLYSVHTGPDTVMSPLTQWIVNYCFIANLITSQFFHLYTTWEIKSWLFFQVKDSTSLWIQCSLRVWFYRYRHIDTVHCMYMSRGTVSRWCTIKCFSRNSSFPYIKIEYPVSRKSCQRHIGLYSFIDAMGCSLYDYAAMVFVCNYLYPQ